MKPMNNRKLVLTGGPCAGKTTIAQVLNRAFDGQLAIVPEAASLLFGGGFPRWTEMAAKESLQRTIYKTQKELEISFESHYPSQLLILDRATIDGAAYWPKGPDDFFKVSQTSLQQELVEYSRVIYLESAGATDYASAKSKNPVRTESWDEAKQLDEITKGLWSKHSHFDFIPNRSSFSDKIFSVLQIVEAELKALGSQKS